MGGSFITVVGFNSVGSLMSLSIFPHLDPSCAVGFRASYNHILPGGAACHPLAIAHEGGTRWHLSPSRREGHKLTGQGQDFRRGSGHSEVLRMDIPDFPLGCRHCRHGCYTRTLT